MRSALRRLVLLVLAGALFAGAAMGQESCESTTVNEADSEADTQAAEPASESAVDETEAEPAPEPQTAAVGDSLTLEGFEGLRMKVTVLKVIDPLAGGEFDAPQGGNRYVGVKIRMRNVSDQTYDDSPSNGAQLLDGQDEQAQDTYVSGGECAGDFASRAKIAPGAKQQGCLVFEMKKGRNPKLFQFALDSGFADQNGEWRLR